MDITTKLSPHFRLAEFLHHGSTEGITADVLENLRLLAKQLETVRAFFGQPIIINSGFRTPAHNAAVGGEPNSYHLKGMAADIVVQRIPAHDVQVMLRDWAGGMGCYAHFTHLDIRPYKARWSQSASPGAADSAT